ncbi:hypothetical protein BRM3_11760 [Brachybacterium huguangmaarense]|uniref:Integral membrane protein n=1 Tax=Brachybacterium huguangmaarense TaxID=1652028 RepID=A0ABY6G0T8_9MICO|nr:hypothetical protein [Brachybacterium huguangmaarense]UYG16279.1 hypothetical protein BRM3_11760 [Brachybacterium huguangmaarense]
MTRRPTRAPARRGERGFATVLIALYGVLAFAATGRAVYEVAVKFGEAPLSYVLSLVSAVTYAVVTVLLVRRGGDSRAALYVCLFELAGVLVVGTLTVAAPGLFHAHTVWSQFGVGYGFFPVLLPVVAISYLLWRRRAVRAGLGDGRPVRA